MTSSNQTNEDVQTKHEQTVADYVGDMVALESHIEEALDRQLDEVKDDQTASAAVQTFHDMVKQHRDTLRALQEEVGSTPGNPIKAPGPRCWASGGGHRSGPHRRHFQVPA
jgi:hypothetical protein